METKISIHIKTEKELYLLMRHFESKNWHCSHSLQIDIKKYPFFNYRDNWNAWSTGYGESVIDFDALATIVGIELPPEEIVIEFTEYIATVKKDSVLLNFERRTGIKLSSETIHEIHTTMQSLKGKE